MRKCKPALALHGGAEPDPNREYHQEKCHMKALIEAGHKRLTEGETALDTALFIITELEDSGLYLAGKGSGPTRKGDYELDAALMLGKTQKAGAVCALQNFANPAKIAYEVLEHSPHILLAGEGAAEFAQKRGYSPIADPKAYFTPSVKTQTTADSLSIGTVGVVVLDVYGDLVAATSTGGVLNKFPGRVGDSPLPGAGVWADSHVAVSTTGQGEYFMRTAAAFQVSARMRFAADPIEQAALKTLQEMSAVKHSGCTKLTASSKTSGGKGGLIALDSRGVITLPYIGSGMKRAAMDAEGNKILAVFETTFF